MFSTFNFFIFLFRLLIPLWNNFIFAYLTSHIRWSSFCWLLTYPFKLLLYYRFRSWVYQMSCLSLSQCNLIWLLFLFLFSFAVALCTTTWIFLTIKFLNIYVCVEIYITKIIINYGHWWIFMHIWTHHSTTMDLRLVYSYLWTQNTFWNLILSHFNRIKLLGSSSPWLLLIKTLCSITLFISKWWILLWNIIWDQTWIFSFKLFFNLPDSSRIIRCISFRLSF